MKNFSSGLPTYPIQSLLKFACVAAILAGCGGGGSDGHTETSFASGPIQGLGSVIVNGVRFDDSSARVSSEDDDGNEVHKSGDLQVGMVVTIQAGAITNDGSGRRAKAREIHFGSELVGPATAIAINADGLTGTFKVLNQTVTVDKATAFDDSLSGGFAGLTDGTIVEVHGLFEAARTTYTATRVEAKTNAAEFKIRGAVSALTATTFKIGDRTINFASITPAPSLRDGQIVRVKVEKIPNAAGELVAIRIKDGTRKADDHNEAEIKGAVTNLAADGKSFNVEGIPVDAKNVTNLPTLKAGDFVEVEGSLTNGTLIAIKVELDDNDGDDEGEFEFHRKITKTGDRTFDLGTTTIVWDDKTVFLNGTTAAALVQGACVEVMAVTKSGSTALLATRIKLDNSCTQ